MFDTDKDEAEHLKKNIAALQKLSSGTGIPSPVKINTLARNLIRLSGYKPDTDIRALVEEVVSTYHPEKGSEGARKDATYRRLAVGE